MYAYAGGNSANRIDPTGLYYCVYSIALHTMTCVPNSPGNPVFSDSNFLSGSNFRNPECNDCRDNENRINVLNTGPLPPGYYNIERQLPNSTRRPLTPDPKFKYNSYGRTGGFQTHFCPNPRDCSEGCIATPSMPIMDRLNGLLGREEGDNQLTVLP